MSERVLNPGRELIRFEDVDDWSALADGLASRGHGAAPSGSPGSTSRGPSGSRRKPAFATDIAQLVQHRRRLRRKLETGGVPEFEDLATASIALDALEGRLEEIEALSRRCRGAALCAEPPGNLDSEHCQTK